MTVNFNNLSLQNNKISTKSLKKIKALISDSSFILGDAVAQFENNFKNYIGCKFAVGVNSGTDAIKLACRSLDLKGDTIIFIPANTYIATYTGAYEAYPDAFFEFVDCDDFYQIDLKDLEQKINKNKNFTNKVVIPVHLYGHTSDMKNLLKLKSKYNFHIVEDCSQAHGAINNLNKKVGTTGTVNAFSLYPGKNLGALGDAGIITTDSEDVYKKLLALRNIGSVAKYIHDEFGYNSRLDSIQAIFLDEKLKLLDNFNRKRIKIAKRFCSEINNSFISLPEKSKYCKKHVYHLFVIKTDFRDALKEYLSKNGIQTFIHYPRPVYDNDYLLKYKIKCKNVDENSGRILSLPMHPFLKNEEISFIIDKLNKFNNE